MPEFDQKSTAYYDGSKPAADPLCPGQLAQYQLLQKRGEGGMGGVYRALHTKTKKTVAVKVLAEDRMRDSQFIARFNREMEAGGLPDHPNLVRVTDAGEVDGKQYLVMEYLEG